MEQLDLLWKYQELDLVMDQYEQERKNHHLRHTLLKLKNYLMEQQDNLVKFDEEASKKHQYYNRIQHEYENMLQLLISEKEKITTGDLNLKQLEQLEKEGTQLRDKTAKKEEELKRLIRELDSFQKKLEDIGHRVAKAKKEYGDTKTAYDQEVKRIQQEYNKVKQRREQYVDKIDKALINKYHNVKSNRVPVIAAIQQDRCGGCNMGLASLVIKNVKDKNRIVECENCGRLLLDDEK